MSRPIHDPTVLRAIAHPLRNRIMGELTAQGPLRAADLSRELGVPANQASFHLRQLAKYGLVEEAVGEGRDRRDRVWRLVDESGLTLDLGELEKQPGGRPRPRSSGRRRRPGRTRSSTRPTPASGPRTTTARSATRRCG